MMDRPCLNRQLDGKTLCSYYYLKEELVAFCRANGLPTSGGKLEITQRIAHFLDSGEVLAASRCNKTKAAIGTLTEQTNIEPDFVCSETHKAFFKQRIGKSFSFNVAFQKWLKANTGKNYSEAIEAYYQIIEDKKKGITTIDKQFEYNTYIRAFFADNKDKTLEQAILCWKYKKGLQGHNCYEQADLIALL